MAQSPAVVLDLAEKLIADLNGSLLRNSRIGKTKRYLAGDHDLPYAPRGARAEYRAIAKRSITNWLPQVSNTYTQGLFVDGYRAARTAENASPWETWKANGMNARQTIITRSALDYGVSFGLTLPGEGSVPVMKPLAATRATAWYEDEDDEWPVLGLYQRGKSTDGEDLYDVFDNEFAYSVVRDGTGKLRVADLSPHRMQVCPMTRFRTRLGEESTGIIWPLINVQDRVNDTVFALMIALQYASFRQRWATGLAIPRDPETGDPIEPFEAAVDRLWASDSPDAKFGDFAQTMVDGHLGSYNSAVRTLAALGQISPNVLTGDLINLSAEALAQLQDATRRQLSEFETVLGESWEQWLRLTAFAAGDRVAASDLGAEVRWRDNEARALAATVDALGKMVQMLQVPPVALWERIPGVTDTDIERWKNERGSADGMALLAAALDRQSEPVAAPESVAAGEAA